MLGTTWHCRQTEVKKKKPFDQSCHQKVLKQLPVQLWSSISCKASLCSAVTGFSSLILFPNSQCVYIPPCVLWTNTLFSLTYLHSSSSVAPCLQPCCLFTAHSVSRSSSVQIRARSYTRSLGYRNVRVQRQSDVDRISLHTLHEALDGRKKNSNWGRGGMVTWPWLII